MKIIDCDQGSQTWLNARIGLVTASEADSIVTPLFAPRTGEGVETYLFRKLAEKALNYVQDDGSTFNMDQGNYIEKVAIPWFAFSFDRPVKRVGFCVNDAGTCGCSPDGLLDKNEGLEIKSPTPPIHLKYFFRNEVPPQYRAQIHFSMMVTGASAWYWCSFSRQFEPLVIRVERDEEIQAKLHAALDPFLEKFDAIYGKIKATQDAENEAKSAEYEKANA